MAELMNSLLKDKMSADALKRKLDQYLRPENFEGLRTLKGPRTYLACVSKEVKFHFRSMASSSFDRAPCC